jgi:hypothetical protein
LGTKELFFDMGRVDARADTPALPVAGSGSLVVPLELGDGSGSAVGSPVRICESTWQLFQGSLLGSVWILHLVEAFGAGEFHLELEARSRAGDGLHAAEDKQETAEFETKISALIAENNQLKADNIQLKTQVEELAAQIQWFQKQLFGKKSERRIVQPATEPTKRTPRPPVH